MKKDTNPLQTNWRKFGIKSSLGSTTIPIEAPELENTANTKPISSGNIDVMSKANNPGGVKLPGLSKLHNSSKNVIEKFNKNSSNLDNISKILNNYPDASGSAYEEFCDMRKALTYEQKEEIDNFIGSKDYSRINERPAPPGRYNLDDAKNRRLGVTLSRIISKIAEDNYGAVTDGDDFWDTDRLAMRRVNRESLYKCRNSREKNNIIILLDSSPSCSKQADFYSKIATQCTLYGDVELYDAPNARLVHIYDNKKKMFVQFITVEDVLRGAHKWSYFKNRTIIFFGDFDGYEVVMKNTVSNKVYYFCTERMSSIKTKMSYTSQRSTPHNFRNLTAIPNVHDVKSFMEACKKLK